MNIFEGITKEKFIEEFNKEGNGSLSEATSLSFCFGFSIGILFRHYPKKCVSLKI
jgi:hypothetical protein